MTFSTAVMLWKSRMFWNVRATPAWVTLNRFIPSMRSPANRTAPSVGENTPVMTLNTVVLPAPFGPMSAKISPSCTVRFASSKRHDTAEAHRDAVELQYLGTAVVGDGTAVRRGAAGFGAHRVVSTAAASGSESARGTSAPSPSIPPVPSLNSARRWREGSSPSGRSVITRTSAAPKTRIR